MRKIIDFFKDVKAEAKNITWPKKDALIQLTIVVISISAIISLVLGGFDYLFTKSLAYLALPNKAKTVQQATSVAPTSTDSAQVATTSSIPIEIKK